MTPESSRVYDEEGAVRPAVDNGFRYKPGSRSFGVVGERPKNEANEDWRESMAELTDYGNHGGDDRWECE